MRNHCRAAWEIHHLLSEHHRCNRKSQLLLIEEEFLKLMYSPCVLIYISILLDVYTPLIWTGHRQCLKSIRGAPEHDSRMNPAMHNEAVIKSGWIRKMYLCQWECFEVVRPESQGIQIPVFTGPMQWLSHLPGSTSEKSLWAVEV